MGGGGDILVTLQKEQVCLSNMSMWMMNSTFSVFFSSRKIRKVPERKGVYFYRLSVYVTLEI